MKKKLVDVLLLGQAMQRLEGGKLQFNTQGALRYARAKNAIRSQTQTFHDQVREEFEKRPENLRTQAEYQKAHQAVLEAINGEEVEIQLPPPIPDAWIQEIQTPSSAEHEALAILTDVVLGSPEATATSP